MVPGLLKIISEHFLPTLWVRYRPFWRFSMIFIFGPPTGGSPGSNLGLIYPQNGTSSFKMIPGLLKIISEHFLPTLCVGYGPSRPSSVICDSWNHPLGSTKDQQGQIRPDLPPNGISSFKMVPDLLKIISEHFLPNLWIGYLPFKPFSITFYFRFTYWRSQWSN